MGNLEQLPSGSWRASVVRRGRSDHHREIRLKATAKTEQQAYIELGRLLEEASEGRGPFVSASSQAYYSKHTGYLQVDSSQRSGSSRII